MIQRSGWQRGRAAGAAQALTIAVIVATGCNGGGGDTTEGATGSTTDGATTTTTTTTAMTTSSSTTDDPSGSASKTGGETTTTTATTTTTTTTTTDTTTTGVDTGPACPPDALECAGECVDPQTDPDHCGGCDVICDRGELCSLGGCKTTCDPGTLQCGRSCVDTQSDPNHCGGCDVACGDLEICAAGECVALLCAPGSEEPCYDGPMGTEDVGLCVAGIRTCADDGMSVGPCVGQVTPLVEDCETEVDDDCDGKVNQGCYVQSCKALKEKDPQASDGLYIIDLDGDDGPLTPLSVYCDMTIDGGGWTRFNWLHEEYVPGTDPLGKTLHECKADDLSCQARIPASAVVSELMVKDITDGHHALWKFNGSTVSNAVLGALQNKQEYCGVNQGAFMPYLTTSAESYCGNGAEGGCDSFFYTSGSCKGVGNWGIHWDGDNAWCAAAFKMGATFSGCGNPGDQGFLNDCDCDDELYYR